MEHHIMARSIKSAVLSKDDTKALITATKAEIKAAKDNAKQLAGIRKEADKVFATAGKAHIAALKENDKAVTASEKTLATLQAKLDTLVPAKVPATA